MPKRSLQFSAMKAFEEERFEDLEYQLSALGRKKDAGYWDPTAYIPGTAPEKLVYNYLLKLGINFQFQYHGEDFPATARDESDWIPDFFLPDYNIRIEVFGEYWHSIPKRKEVDLLKLSYWKQAGYAVYRDGMPSYPEGGGFLGKLIIWWEWEIWSNLTFLFMRDLPELYESPIKKGKAAEIIFNVESQKKQQRALSASLAIKKMRPKIPLFEKQISRRFKIKPRLLSQIEKEMGTMEQEARGLGLGRKS